MKTKTKLDIIKACKLYDKNNVISFEFEFNDSYYMSYWSPIMSGTTQITGTLLFADNPATFKTYITLTTTL